METPKVFTEHPRDGGSYIANPDGTYTQREATTGERRCKCRPESAATAPTAAAAPAVEATADDAPPAPQRKARHRSDD